MALELASEILDWSSENKLGHVTYKFLCFIQATHLAYCLLQSLDSYSSNIAKV